MHTQEQGRNAPGDTTPAWETHDNLKAMPEIPAQAEIPVQTIDFLPTLVADLDRKTVRGHDIFNPQQCLALATDNLRSPPPAAPLPGEWHELVNAIAAGEFVAPGAKQQ